MFTSFLFPCFLEKKTQAIQTKFKYNFFSSTKTPLSINAVACEGVWERGWAGDLFCHTLYGGFFAYIDY